MDYLEKLIAYAKKRGNQITFLELNEKFESLSKRELLDEEVDEIIEALDKNEIKIVDEKNDSKEVQELDYVSLTAFKAYMRDINTVKQLTEEEKHELIIKASNGDIKARKAFANQYLRLVINIAKKIYLNYTLASTTLEDLIGFGNLGLMTAIDRYDYKKGYRFTTYSTWWIRQAIYRGIRTTDREIRTPVHAVEEINKLKKYIAEYYQDHGHYPTQREQMAHLKVNQEKLEFLQKNDCVTNLASLDETVGEDEKSTLGEFVPSKDLSVEDQVIENEKKELVGKALDILLERKLSEVERKFKGKNMADPKIIANYNSAISYAKKRIELIKNRFGIKVTNPEVIAQPEVQEKIEFGSPLTLDELGKKFNLSRERVRQMLEKDMGRLKRIINELMVDEPIKKRKKYKETKQEKKPVEQLRKEAEIETEDLFEEDFIPVSNTLFTSTYNSPEEKQLYEDVCADKQIALYGQRPLYTKRILIEAMKKYNLFWAFNAVREMTELDRLVTLFEINYDEFKLLNRKIEGLKSKITCFKYDDQRKQATETEEEIIALEKQQLGYIYSLRYLIRRANCLPVAQKEYFYSVCHVNMDEVTEKIKKYCK